MLMKHVEEPRAGRLGQECIGHGPVCKVPVLPVATRVGPRPTKIGKGTSLGLGMLCRIWDGKDGCAAGHHCRCSMRKAPWSLQVSWR